MHRRNRKAAFLVYFLPSEPLNTHTYVDTHPHSILCVFRLEMRALSKTVCQGVCLVDRWFSGWFYENIPLWSQLGWSKKDRDERQVKKTAQVIWWRGLVQQPGEYLRACASTHTRAHTLQHTHEIAQQMKCAAGCMRPESESESVLSRCVSRRAAKSSSTTKSATDLISLQMDS